MWKCPKCGKNNQENIVCSCGWTRAKDYLRYHTLCPIGEAEKETLHELLFERDNEEESKKYGQESIQYLPEGELRYDFFSVIEQKINKDEIQNIIFEDLEKQTTLTKSYDVSSKQDGSVVLWITENENGYDLHIGGKNSVKAPENCRSLFRGFSNVRSIVFRDSFKTDHVEYMNHMFAECEGLVELDLSGFVTMNVVNMQYMFSGCKRLFGLNLCSFDTRNVTNMAGMFLNCEWLEEIDVSCFNTKHVTNMSAMFYGCESLDELDVKNFDTENVTDMSAMFGGCRRLKELDVSNFVTKNVLNMDFMFKRCEQLKKLNVKNFDTKNVKRMWHMFKGCKCLKKIDISGFNTESVINMSDMFEDCVELDENGKRLSWIKRWKNTLKSEKSHKTYKNL